jgi:hypothetical protein
VRDQGLDDGEVVELMLALVGAAARRWMPRAGLEPAPPD